MSTSTLKAVIVLANKRKKCAETISANPILAEIAGMGFFFQRPRSCDHLFDR